MARFNVNEADNYGGNGQSSFFSLKNDKDTATVRFMYNTLEDIEGYAVHEIEVGGKKRYVNCLRSYNEPIDACPLCAARYRVLAKLFVTLYDEDAQEIKVWDRGKTFFSKLASLCSRYNPLVATPFEIERNGKKGDTNTTYETYALESDGTTLEDLPEVPELLGTLILDKSYEELEYYLENGEFEEDEVERITPPTNNQRTPATEAPRRRVPTNTEPARTVGAKPAAARRLGATSRNNNSGSGIPF